MSKFLMSLIFMVMAVYGQVSFTQMLCMTDSAGRDVYLWGPDTSTTLSKVVKVVYGTGGYTVTFRNGHEVVLSRPPFNRMEIVSTPDTVVADTTTKKSKSDRAKDDDDKKGRR